jgi:hypothetical protein
MVEQFDVAIRSRTMTVRAFRALALLTTLGLAASSCDDPPPLSRVHVTITNLHDTLGLQVADRDSGAIDVLFPSTMVDGGLVRRAIYWDLSDTFQFDVQIPAGTYGPPRFEGRAFVACGERTPELIVAVGNATSGFTVSSSAARTDAPPIAAAVAMWTCP